MFFFFFKSFQLHEPLSPEVDFIMLTDILPNKQIVFPNNHLKPPPHTAFCLISLRALNYLPKTVLVIRSSLYWANAHQPHEPLSSSSAGGFYLHPPVDARLSSLNQIPHRAFYHIPLFSRSLKCIQEVLSSPFLNYLDMFCFFSLMFVWVKDGKSGGSVYFRRVWECGVTKGYLLRIHPSSQMWELNPLLSGP